MEELTAYDSTKCLRSQTDGAGAGAGAGSAPPAPLLAAPGIGIGAERERRDDGRKPWRGMGVGVGGERSLWTSLSTVLIESWF